MSCEVQLPRIMWDSPPTVLVHVIFSPGHGAARTEERPRWPSPADPTQGTYEDFSAMLGLPWRWR